MSSDQPTDDLQQETVAVYRLSDLVEAEIVENLLLANGIRCMIRRVADSPLPGTEQHGRWGVVRVFERDESTALEILEEYKKNRDKQPGYEF